MLNYHLRRTYVYTNSTSSHTTPALSPRASINLRKVLCVARLDGTPKIGHSARCVWAVLVSTSQQTSSAKTSGPSQVVFVILWMDEILHHFETMGSRCLLVFTGESSFQGFLGGAKWISSIHCLVSSSFTCFSNLCQSA